MMTTRQTVLEQAKQGDGEAIAFLLNLAFNKQNQRVEVRVQEKQLELSIVASVLPPQEQTTRQIANAIAHLNVPNLETIVVCGKLPQCISQKEMECDRPSWQQTVRFFPNSSQIDPFNSSIDISLPESPADLTEYCFIRNQFRLKGTMTMPPESAVQLVLSFAALTSTQKLEVIPCVYSLLFQIDEASESLLSANAQSWLNRLAILEPSELGGSLIWLSRYCSSPLLTTSQLRQTASLVSPNLLPNYALGSLLKPPKQTTLTNEQIAARLEVAEAGSYRLPKWSTSIVLVSILGLMLSRCAINLSYSSDRAYVHAACVKASGAEVCDSHYNSVALYPVLLLGGVLMVGGLFSLLRPE